MDAAAMDVHEATPQVEPSPSQRPSQILPRSRPPPPAVGKAKVPKKEQMLEERAI
jgi:hypothetical protein